jgi:hypothetical protein
MLDMAQSAKKNGTLPRSFPRRRESRSAGDGVVTHIRACAGMTRFIKSMSFFEDKRRLLSFGGNHILKYFEDVFWGWNTAWPALSVLEADRL